jgi:hypothetical protein
MQDIDDVSGLLTESGLEIFAVHPLHLDDVAIVLTGLSQRAADFGQLQLADDVELVVKLRDVGRCRKLVVEHLDGGHPVRPVVLPAKDLRFLAFVDQAISHLASRFHREVPVSQIRSKDEPASEPISVSTGVTARLPRHVPRKVVLARKPSRH